MEEKMTKFENAIKKILAYFIKNLIIQDVNGTEIEFPDVVSPGEIQIGVSGKVEGKPAEGSFTLPTGETLVFVGGLITEKIVPEPIDDKAKLQAENEALKAELEKVKAEFVVQITELKNEYVKFKGQFKKEVQPVSVPPAEKYDGQTERVFNWTKKKSIKAE